MKTENLVYSKIKEISARGIQPRPAIAINDLSKELALSYDMLLPHLTNFRQLKLLNYCDSKMLYIRLTLLGSVVKRDK